MRTKLSPLFSLVFAATLLYGSTVSAQTGPTGPKSPNNGPGAVPAANLTSVKRLSPEALADYLRQQNHKVQLNKGTDGRSILLVQIEQKDWKYEIQIEYMPDQNSFYMLSHVGKAGAQSSAAQLAEILKTNQKIAPAYFSIWPDGRLCLEDYYGSQMDTALFQATLNRYLGKIQQTYSTWDNSRWTTPGSGPTAQVAP
jgi:hypothetical protein